MSIGGPFGMQAVYTPLVNYNTEFPQLAGPRPQMHMEPPPPPPIPQQRMQRPPWGTHGPGNMSFRHPDPVMTPYTPGHAGPHSGMAMYMHAPQYAYPGPSMAYVHPHDRFQQSISQVLLLESISNHLFWACAERVYHFFLKVVLLACMK